MKNKCWIDFAGEMQEFTDTNNVHVFYETMRCAVVYIFFISNFFHRCTVSRLAAFRRPPTMWSLPTPLPYATCIVFLVYQNQIGPYQWLIYVGSVCDCGQV